MSEETTGTARAGTRAAMAVSIAAASLVVFLANYVAQSLQDRRGDWARALAADIGGQTDQLVASYEKVRAGDDSAAGGLRQSRERITGDILRLRNGDGVNAGYEGAAGVGTALEVLDVTWRKIDVEIELVLPGKPRHPEAYEANDVVLGETSQLATGAADLRASFDRMFVRRLFPSRLIGIVSGIVALLAMAWLVQLWLAVRRGRASKG